MDNVARINQLLHGEFRRDRQFVDMYHDVLEFHRVFGLKVGQKPEFPDKEVLDLRLSIEEEEFSELKEALQENDLAGVADAIADFIYVLLGRAVSFGIDIRPVWKAVHEANMKKAGGGRREDGKVLKPEGWKPPDIESIIEEQIHGA